MQLTFNFKQDLKKLMAAAALPRALILGAVGTVNAAPADADRDGIKDGDEDRDRDGVDNTNELRLRLAMNDANSDNDAIREGIEDRDGDSIDNENEDDMEASSDPFAPGVEDDDDNNDGETDEGN